MTGGVFELPQPRYLPCPDCGASLERGHDDEHECDEERRLDYLLLQHRGELELLDGQLAEWLDSPSGRFAAWLAEHGRR